MKTIARDSILVVVVALYIVGSIGFTVHHCCCHKFYHTSCCLLDGFSPYKIDGCHKIAEDLLAGDKLVFKQYRHCGDFVYSMEHGKYSHTEKQNAPILYLVMIQDLSDNLVFSDISNQASFNDISDIFFYNHVFKRRWQNQESLCSFLI